VKISVSSATMAATITSITTTNGREYSV
jgi:hypothetical protein